MARGYNPSRFGSFAEGLLGGIERSQNMRIRYEQDELAKEQREDRLRAREFNRGMPTTVEQFEQSATTNTGPLADPDQAFQETFNPRAQIESMRAQASLIEDPKRREAALKRIDEMEFRGVQAQAVAAYQAWQAGDQRGMKDALNRGYSYSGGPGQFNVDPNGNLKAPDGQLVDETYINSMALMVKDPVAGIEYMRNARAEAAALTEDKRRDMRDAGFKDRQVGVSERNAAVNERRAEIEQGRLGIARDQADIEIGMAPVDAALKRAQARKYDAEAKARLAEIEADAAPAGMRPDDASRIHKGTLDTVDVLLSGTLEDPNRSLLSPTVQKMMADPGIGSTVRSQLEGLASSMQMATRGEMSPQTGILLSQRVMEDVFSPTSTIDVNPETNQIRFSDGTVVQLTPSGTKTVMEMERLLR